MRPAVWCVAEMPPATQSLEPAQLAQLRSAMARTLAARLAFELQHVQLGDAAVGPQIGRQPHLGERVAVEVEGQALDAAGAEVPAGDDAVGCDVAERLVGMVAFAWMGYDGGIYGAVRRSALTTLCLRTAGGQ